MKHFEIKDSEGTDLLEYFAKIREGFSPEELTRHNVAGAVLVTTSSIVMRRNYLGLTQEELAARCGYTIRTISAIENNEMTPSFHRVVRVLYELGYEFELKDRGQTSYVYNVRSSTSPVPNREPIFSAIQIRARNAHRLLVGIRS